MGGTSSSSPIFSLIATSAVTNGRQLLRLFKEEEQHFRPLLDE
jgi:hypothetical protein